MGFSIRRLLLVIACLTLAACGTPRGAGIQSEVLAADAVKTDSDGNPIYDFAVYEVTRDSVASLNRWPSLDHSKRNWIKRQNQPGSLIIAAGDVLSIVIWDAEENSLLTGPGQRSVQLQDTPVSSSGRIFLPFVGQMRVSGMSADTARNRIEERLTETIPSAQVQLTVAPGRSNTANLVSGVNAPGVYPLPDRNYTLLALLSQGGGVLGGLNNPQISLMRGNKVYGTSLARVFDDPALDTTLRGGDRIIIEDDDRSFLSLGAAGSEARHNFVDDHVTALEAMSIIGGVADARADPQGVLIMRQYQSRHIRSDGTGPTKDRVVFTIDLTTADGLFSAGQFHIMPDDLVYATESPINAASTIFGLLGSVLGIANRL